MHFYLACLVRFVLVFLPIPLLVLRPPRPTLFPYTTLFRSKANLRRPRLCRSAPIENLTCCEADSKTEARRRSEEHTSELQSPCNLVCRLLLEKKKCIYI